MASANSKVLLISNKMDIHADAVITELDSLGVDTFRLNTECLLSDYKVIGTHNGAKSKLSISDVLGRSLQFPVDVLSIYYRKPEDVVASSAITDVGARDFAVSEGRELLQTIYCYQNVRWICHPYAIRLASRKFHQLFIAENFGMTTPKTLLTNDPNELLTFFDACNGDIICKTLNTSSVRYKGENYSTFTARVPKEHLLEHIDNVKHTPTLFQERLQKATELRITCIGNDVFACELDSQKIPESRTDWREVDPFTIPHREVRLPSALQHSLYQFLEHYDLSFGAFDFVRTSEGEYIFLECNPNGQWYWIELITKMPMARAMAKHLIQDNT